MIVRLLLVLTLLAACSSNGQDITKSLDVSAARLAEIKSKPYTAGNGPGGFAAAGLSGTGDDSKSDRIVFTGVGPYLHEMGFTSSMTITAIDGQGVYGIFYDRWKNLRLQSPDAFDAAHYKDLIEYIFAKEPGDSVVISIDVDVSTADLLAGITEREPETWRISFLR